MLKRSHYMAIGLVLALLLLILILPAHTTARLKLAIGSLFLPLFGLASSSHQLEQKADDTLTSRKELLKQVSSLREENEKLRTQALQTDELLRENNRLRSQLKWQETRKAWNLRLANVIARDPANWWRTIQIDLGSRDGVRTNCAVLTPDGLVGRVSAVGFTRSQVVLLGDSECKVSAMIQETRDTGVIGASGPFEGSLATMSYLKEPNVKANQTVITSGIGPIFPPGIPIGKIVDARPVEYGLYTEARVKLSANLSALEEVWVWMQ
jgi:rod shape-determining protein MreC